MPLLSHRSPDALVAYRGRQPITALQFLADVERVAAALPPGAHVLNVCADRYRFAVTLAASLLTRKVSLLPSTHTPEVIRQMVRFAPDVFCVFDTQAGGSVELPSIAFPEGTSTTGCWREAAIDDGQLAAYVFTSGSTGTPLPHRKTWGRLVACVRQEAQRLGLGGGRAYHLVGTVPPQHMYGLESTVLLPLQSGGTFSASRPFYPADIASALESLPAPRTLVTTPIHLRTLLTSGVSLPSIELVLSATAPLSTGLACETEERLRTRLLEVYGSTETGQIASRRTARTDEWQLFDAVTLSEIDGRAWADGGHVEQPTPLCDVVEICGASTFRLLGRLSDLVNIAGKRSSLAYLNHQLNAIPGVLDGSFFVREDAPDARAGPGSRVAAVVVAPDLDAQTLLDRLRERIDPVFLPRPLLFVDRLPRNATGKLPLEAIQSLAAAAIKRDPPSH